MSEAATTRRWAVLRRETGRALGAAIIALAVAFLIILFSSKTPLQAFATLTTAPITKVRTVGLWIDDVAKLTVAGLAYSLVFQARQFALGVQGQVYVGALAASYIALSPLGQTWCAIPLGIVCAMAGGALWGFLPGIAKARLGANEIVSSLMLNYVAIELANYLIRVDLTTPNSRLLSTAPFPSTAVFPALIPNTRIDIGLIFALTSVVAVWFALYRTSWGLKLRLVGHNSRFAQYAGIKEAFIIVSAMAASGALGGLLGAMFVEGRSFGKLAVSFEGNLAFEGLLIAIVARNRPLAVPVAALFYGYLRQGAQLMSIRTDVPSEIIVIVTAVIILLVASSYSVKPLAMLAAIRRSSRPARTHAEAVK
ncbi:ABC transporter permease [Mesorhizobium sp. M2E.F.Ca.ET.209.01.1.1]|uniref:ABC transporter permease n=1 Tax=Mesorhizobium sp. M2E.F.Ca.ET.209.01.1.1 TaxID=2500526 RepID=UPI000FDC448C|nr:ABC transporter permease [Mesorhizobium sp. M2E.F.Ca.ET.209.01.1.1]TGS10918.1 ABC transporter permease [Mesorhizobium sp. M2E.F.Ca.ET.209.01.1.1]